MEGNELAKMGGRKSVVSQLVNAGRMPDILDCIANLSSDEVFTPPELVDKMLDLFPDEVWHNPNLKWLDPACKTGIFLRQIAKRLMTGLREEIPDEEKRRRHIFQNMLYGVALTDLTALMSRRSVYTSKNADSEKSIGHFDSVNGNISYDNRPHTYVNKVCKYCGNKEGGELDRDETKERHAYNFIHLTEEEAKNMKFDIIVGNPPYQLNDGGAGASASPIYQYFVWQAKKLNPRYMSFIIPSRWFAGGKGLDGFRDEMLHDRRIKKIVDYPDANDCFPGVEIKGGVSYFIWDSEYDGDCEVSTMVGDEEVSKMSRRLDEYDTFVRWNQAIPILRKVQSFNEATMDSVVSGRKPFGLPTNFDKYDNIKNPDKYKIYANKKTGYVLKTRIQMGINNVDKWKVLLPYANEGSGVFPNKVVTQPIIAEPGSVCTETYLVVSAYDNETEAENLVQYIKTRFFRFLLLMHKATQHTTAKVYSFVPDLSMNEVWTDEKLYKKYDITPEEQKFIESLVKEM